ncbi:hypothetical protein EXS65_01370 [Candidatus Peribacteria bacterium]|nr:hypothetical protein [Candidatus Peribacteria bacterium]
MSDQSQPQTSGLVIPPEVQEKFGALILLIQGSESMNNEERQYWVNILPVMTPEQIKNLQEILANEKQQLAAIDAKYTKEAAKSPPIDTVAIGEKMKSKKEKRQKIEEEDAAKEEVTEAELLGKIQSM